MDKLDNQKPELSLLKVSYTEKEMNNLIMMEYFVGGDLSGNFISTEYFSPYR